LLLIREVRVSTTNPGIYFNENIVTTFNLLEAVRKKDVKELVSHHQARYMESLRR
jgi:UDP-glucose 4-epimerase